MRSSWTTHLPSSQVCSYRRDEDTDDLVLPTGR